jgi:6-phosphofructokinase
MVYNYKAVNGLLNNKIRRVRMTDRSKSIEHCGKVLAAVRTLQVEDGEQVETGLIALVSGLTEAQVVAAIESMTRGKHPQVDGDRYGVSRINDIRHTY